MRLNRTGIIVLAVIGGLLIFPWFTPPTPGALWLGFVLLVAIAAVWGVSRMVHEPSRKEE